MVASDHRRFLHGGLFHFLMNTWVIFDLGARTEEFYGTSRYLVIYFVSGICGFVLSMFWSSTISIGASAAACGLIGAMMAYGRRTGSSFIWSFYLRWAILIAVIGLLPGFRIDNAAHLGGFLAGFSLGYVAKTPQYGSPVEGLWRLAARLAVLLVVLSFAMAYQLVSEILFPRRSFPGGHKDQGERSRFMTSRRVMNLAVFLDQRYHRTPDGTVWTDGPMPFTFFERYLRVFDQVRVVARVGGSGHPSEKWKPASGPGVTFSDLPYYVGAWQYLTRARRVAGAGAGLAWLGRRGDLACSLPGVDVRGSKPAPPRPAVRRRGGGRSVHSYAPGSVRHPLRPLFRYWFRHRLRQQCAGRR